MLFPTSYRALKENEFSSGHYRLIPIRFEDRLLIRKWRNEQIYHLRQEKALTEEDQTTYFETTVASLFQQERPSQILFSFLKNNECIGYGGLVHINWIDKHAEISFIMDTELESSRFEEIWTVYLSILHQIAFEELQLHKLFTYAFDLRPHLYPVLEKSGFQLEARLKDHCFFNGEYKDVLIHRKLNSSPHLFLREVNEEDIRLLFDWANDPAVRLNSLQSDKIPFETHQQWFHVQLNNPDTKLFVLTDGITPLGQIRIQRRDALWEIGYSIDENQRGKKLGEKIVCLLLSTFNEYSYRAVVKKDNHASIKVFKNLGFEEQPSNQTDILIFIKKSES